MMNKTLRLLLVLGLAALLLFSLGRIAMIQWDYWSAKKLYEELRDEAFRVELPPPPPQETEAGEETEEEAEAFPQVYIDLEGLQAVNPDVLGWLWIPDTEVSYPLLQGADNQKYLNRNYQLGYDVGGSIFMDFRNQADLSDDNTVLYGHNMKNKAMFGGLKQYAAPEYRQAHPYIYLFTEAGALKYSVFAAYKTESTSESYARELGEGMGEFLAYIASCAGETLTELPDEGTRLLTLSTCTSVRKTERFVLHAALVGMEP